MLIVGHPVDGMEHHKPPMKAFAEGLKAYGHDFRMTDQHTTVKEADIDLIWSRKSIGCCCGIPLILECGYINDTSGDYQKDRHRFISTSWHDQHGRSWKMPPAKTDRWEDLGIELQPWTTAGDYALLLKQVKGDVMAPKERQWLQLLAAATTRYGEVVVREHPRNRRKQDQSLDDQLFHAHTAITYGSNSAVEAIIAGVPIVTKSRYSIAYPVAAHRVDERAWMGDRTQWAADLAYRQWTFEEFRSGEAWDWLHQGTKGIGRDVFADTHYPAATGP